MTTIDQLANMDGRVVLITGGAGKLGYAIGQALHEAGASIILLDMNREDTENAAADLSVGYSDRNLGIGLDITNKEAVAELPAQVVKKYGRLDVLINCAALVGSSGLSGWAVPIEQQNIQTWEKAIDVNLTAAFQIIQCLLPLLKASDFGSIINLGSIYGSSGQKLGLYRGTDYLTPAAYAASKGGLKQLTVYLATVLAPEIRVNMISPGGILRGQNTEFVERYCDMTPLNRMATEDDFKGVSLFLASNLSRYVTGQDIVVDGGWSL